MSTSERTWDSIVSRISSSAGAWTAEARRHPRASSRSIISRVPAPRPASHGAPAVSAALDKASSKCRDCTWSDQTFSASKAAILITFCALRPTVILSSAE